VLEGRFFSRICDPEGREVCVGFHVGPGIVTPTIARTRGGVSLVSIEAITDATLARIDAPLLTELMLDCLPVRDWANGVLRETLGAKADREWCLAALGGADRLTWFRETFPGYEAVFPHVYIASFLGMTPVTLSRLRRRDR
jgi:CRP-like cAMP-binding protein